MDSMLFESLHKQKQEQIDILKRVVPDRWDGVVEASGSQVFVTIPASNDRRYMLRIDIPERFPMGPADYTFVNPETRTDARPEFWPKNASGILVEESPPWICIKGTKAYSDHHPDGSSSSSSLAKVVSHIFQSIRGNANE